MYMGKESEKQMEKKVKEMKRTLRGEGKCIWEKNKGCGVTYSFQVYLGLFCDEQTLKMLYVQIKNLGPNSKKYIIIWTVFVIYLNFNDKIKVRQNYINSPHA